MPDPGTSPVLSGRLEPGNGRGPVLVVGDRHIPWALVGEVLAGGGSVDLALVVTPTSTPVTGAARPVMTVLTPPAPALPAPGPVAPPPAAPTPPPAPPATPVAAPTPGPLTVSLAPRPPLRPPVDEVEAEAWAEAVTLLRECLPRRPRCPVGDLLAVCARVRTAVSAGGAVWDLVGDAAGWDGAPPADDVDLWTGAAMALISVAVDGMDPESARCLDGMELDDWLSTVLELVRSGPGTPADPDSLLALSARCLDVDTAAVDPALAPIMAAAFSALQPVWWSLGAIDSARMLTPLGAWGLPLAIARAWGGWLDDPS